MSSSSLQSTVSIGSVQVPKWAAVAGGVAAVGTVLALFPKLRLKLTIMDSLFQRETAEEKLLNHVVANAIEGNADSVMDTIDKFCWNNNWMMNVGDDKGAILDKEVIAKKPKVALELGAYCGYSAVRIGRLLPADGHLYSIEFSPFRAAIATKVVEWAGLKNKVTILIGTLGTRIDHIKNKLKLTHFDLVFIDHVKSLYLSDFQLLETNNLLAPTSVVVADNVLVPGAPDYLAYIQQHKGYKSVGYDTNLEYMSHIKDQVWVSTKL